MKLLIEGNTVPVRYRSQFVVEVEVMYGDADGSDVLEISGFKENCETSMTHMEFLLNTLLRMKDAYPHGRGGMDTYDHIEGFLKWFSGEMLDELREWYEGLARFEQKFYEQAEWPYNPPSYDVQASYSSHKVFYYDEHGNKHKVTVKL